MYLEIALLLCQLFYWLSNHICISFIYDILLFPPLREIRLAVSAEIFLATLQQLFAVPYADIPPAALYPLL